MLEYLASQSSPAQDETKMSNTTAKDSTLSVVLYRRMSGDFSYVKILKLKNVLECLAS